MSSAPEERSSLKKKKEEMKDGLDDKVRESAAADGGRPHETPLMSAIAEEAKQPAPGISSETMYETLVPVKSSTQADNPGVKALKQFHLKTPDCYGQ